MKHIETWHHVSVRELTSPTTFIQFLTLKLATALSVGCLAKNKRTTPSSWAELAKASSSAHFAAASLSWRLKDSSKFASTCIIMHLDAWSSNVTNTEWKCGKTGGADVWYLLDFYSRCYWAPFGHSTFCSEIQHHTARPAHLFPADPERWTLANVRCPETEENGSNLCRYLFEPGLNSFSLSLLFQVVRYHTISCLVIPLSLSPWPSQGFSYRRSWAGGLSYLAA